jgi:hypothetical protein
MSRLDWDSEVRPVLVAIYRVLNEAESVSAQVESEEVNRLLGREPRDERLDFVLAYLQRADYIDGYRAFGGVWNNITLLGPGLVEVAGWPATPGEDYAAKLLDVLDERIAEAPDPEERTRLERFRDAVGTVGTGVVTGVLTDLARRHGV